MRIALVSPYSWTYPGGVTRHIEALARAARRHGPRRARPGAVRPDRPPHGAAAPRRASRRRASCPDWLVPLGPTIGFPSNGAVSNLAHTPYAIATLRARAARRRLRRRPPARAGRADARLGRAVLDGRAARRHLPLLLGERASPTASRRCIGARRKLNRLRCGSRSPRPPPGPAGASTAARYRIIPNGVARARRRRRPRRASAVAGRAAADRLRRPGRRAQGPAGPAARLRGAARARARRAARSSAPTPRRSRRCCSTDATGVTVARQGRRRRRSAPRSRDADVLAAPSLGGESFGMVLTEAFAAGTPVVASDIAGYRDVVARRRRRRARAARRRRPRSPRRCATSRSTPRAAPRWAPRAAERAPALRLAARRRARCSRPTRTRSRVPRAATPRAARRASASARCRPTWRRAARRAACRRSSRRAAAGARAARRSARAPRGCWRRRRRRPRGGSLSRCSASASTAIGHSLAARQRRRGSWSRSG